MIIFVEHDVDGNIVHSAEVYLTEGLSVEPERPGMTDEELADRKKRVADAIAKREEQTRAELAQANSNHAGLIVLPKGTARPEHSTHKVDMATKKVRPMTGPEKAAWGRSHAPTGTPANPTV